MRNSRASHLGHGAPGGGRRTCSMAATRFSKARRRFDRSIGSLGGDMGAEARRKSGTGGGAATNIMGIGRAAFHTRQRNGGAGCGRVGSQAPTRAHSRSASAGAGRSQKATLRARVGKHIGNPVKDGDLRTATQAMGAVLHAHSRQGFPRQTPARPVKLQPTSPCGAPRHAHEQPCPPPNVDSGLPPPSPSQTACNAH
jgi:hypothetical protein